MKFLKKFKELFFSDKNESSVLESLPRKKSIDQLKMVRKISKGIDIGDRIPKIKDDVSNLEYIRNPIDTGIESYEDFQKNENLKQDITNNKMTKGSSEVKYGYVSLVLNQFDSVLNVDSIIDEHDIYDGFHRNETHLTLLYGLTDNIDVKTIKSKFKNIEPFDIKLGSISIFEKEDYDVVKFDILRNSTLFKINENLKEISHIDTYEYNPHITIAYVKKGAGYKYINKNFTEIVLKKCRDIKYSPIEGDDIFFKLRYKNKQKEK